MPGPRPGEVEVRPTLAHENAAAIFGWKIMGWRSYEEPGSYASNTLLERMESDGHDPHAFCSVPTTAPVDVWVRRLRARNAGAPLQDTSRVRPRR